MTRHRARPSFTVEIKRSRTSPLPDGERPQSERPAGKPSTGFSNPAEALFKPQGAAKPPAAVKPAAAKPLGAPKPAASAPGPSEPETRPSSPSRNLWAGTGLFEEAAAATQSGRFDPPEPPIFGKAPAEVQADKNLADKIFATKDSALSKTAASPKRVLPSLIAPPEPEPEPEVAPEPEPKLPRVRRYRTAEPAPRRTAGPRPAFVWPEDWPDEAPIQTPAPITVPAAARRPERIELPKTEAAPQGPEDGETRPRVKRRTGDEDLRIGQRWKRRLPRVCW